VSGRVSEPVAILLNRIERAGLPAPVCEHEFAKPLRRKWRFDACWPLSALAVEVDGGSWIAGRHTRGKGFESDCRKLNTAVQLGWRVVRFTPAMIESGEAVAVLQVLLR
jgi:very-short-patch-repair endonuclease